jgi:hypothetical protein
VNFEDSKRGYKEPFTGPFEKRDLFPFGERFFDLSGPSSRSIQF